MRLGRSAEQKKLKSLGPSPTMELDLLRLPEVAPKGNFKPDVANAGGCSYSKSKPAEATSEEVKDTADKKTEVEA